MMKNIQDVILGLNTDTIEFLIPFPQTITIIGKEGIALARKISEGKIDEGDVVSLEEKFITDCEKEDKIILELVCDCLLFAGEIITSPS